MLLSAQASSDSVQAASPGDWTSLSDPPNLAAWRGDHWGWKILGDASVPPTAPQQFDKQPGRGVILSDGDATNLESLHDYQDLAVRLEFMIPRQSNSGVKLMGRYEVQILDTHGATELSGDSCGGIYPRAEEMPSYHHIDKGTPPRVNAAKPAGAWQSLEIEFVAPRFDAANKKTANAKFVRVVLNGKTIHENVEVTAPTGSAWRLVSEAPRGPLLLQGNHGPVAFRNIQVRPRNE